VEEGINWKFVTYNDNSAIVRLISGVREKDDVDYEDKGLK